MFCCSEEAKRLEKEAEEAKREAERVAFQSSGQGQTVGVSGVSTEPQTLTGDQGDSAAILASHQNGPGGVTTPLSEASASANAQNGKNFFSLKICN